jgi:hypothetical protein
MRILMVAVLSLLNGNAVGGESAAPRSSVTDWRKCTIDKVRAMEDSARSGKMGLDQYANAKAELDRAERACDDARERGRFKLSRLAEYHLRVVASRRMIARGMAFSLCASPLGVVDEAVDEAYNELKHRLSGNRFKALHGVFSSLDRSGVLREEIKREMSCRENIAMRAVSRACASAGVRRSFADDLVARRRVISGVMSEHCVEISKMANCMYFVSVMSKSLPRVEKMLKDQGILAVDDDTDLSKKVSASSAESKAAAAAVSSHSHHRGTEKGRPSASGAGKSASSAERKAPPAAAAAVSSHSHHRRTEKGRPSASGAGKSASSAGSKAKAPAAPAAAAASSHSYHRATEKGRPSASGAGKSASSARTGSKRS